MSGKVKCRDVLGCNQIDCPAYDTEDLCCWLMGGEHCRQRSQGGVLPKIEGCLTCPVFRRNIDPETMDATFSMIAHQFTKTRKALQNRDRELESVSMEMAIGLSEVFEALQKIADGDPMVRVQEESTLELIAKLKQLVNQTAEHMGEMVEMAHEFAMGLAEHFDVLHRVSNGDMNARVQSVSTIEILNSLKTVTNQMIESVKREIDHRRKVTRDLQISEERFRTFAENAPIGITIMNPDLTFAFINKTFTEIFGYTKADIPDKTTWFKKAYPDKNNREELISLWKTYGEDPALIDGIRPITVKVTCKDGQIKSIGFRTVVNEDGKHFVTYSDITREVQALDVLKESEEKYRTLIENIQDGVFIIEKDKIIFVNEALARMTGYSIDEMNGMDFSRVIAPEDREMVISRYHKRQSGEEVLRNYEFRLLHKDGETRLTVNIHVGVIQYKKHTVTIGTLKDITEKKRAEEEKRAIEKKLQQSKKMEAICTLAGGVAHDLNNILSGVVSYPELLLMDLPDDSPLKEPILTIQKSGERAAAIVQDLLTLARRNVAIKAAIDLNQIVDEYLGSPEFAKLSTFHPLVKVDCHLSNTPLVITGSPVHLSKTIMNLVSNAAEAMPDGGRITLSSKKEQISGETASGNADNRRSSFASLKVTDEGVGISAKDMERIFEPFYTKKVMGRSGTGLGMAVVWGTVKDHKGHIEVTSTEGKGTTFSLYLPLSSEKEPEKEVPFVMDTLMGSGQRILIVDDVQEQREIASAMLNRFGYRTAAVASGEEAVDYLKVHFADLVILDMIMDPGIDGLETYRRIEAFKPGQKAIVASGYSETDRMKSLNRMGVRDYLKKPYSLENVGRIVKKALTD